MLRACRGKALNSGDRDVELRWTELFQKNAGFTSRMGKELAGLQKYLFVDSRKLNAARKKML